MSSESGRFVLVFNGECYNHLDIRAALPERAWRGHSDTETLLAAIDRWGLEATLGRMVGMFALALWDRAERTLSIARDRMGEKPLFYGWHGGVFLFGSELKALRLHPAFRGIVDQAALASFLRHGYVPAPHSIYENTWKLPPGTWLCVSGSTGRAARPVAYWSLERVTDAAAADPFRGNRKEAVDELERLLSSAIGMQRVADVPLGAFLSGGIDSSAVVSLMQAQSSVPVRTFTIGFHEGGFDEAPHAAAVARHLGTEHTQHYVTSAEALELIPQLPQLYDEPFGDASALPTALVARLARQQVAVALSGDGGDELFFGYSRYLRLAQLYRRLRRMPPVARRAAGTASAWIARGLLQPLLRVAPTVPGAPRLERKAARAAGTLRSESLAEFYRVLVSHWDDPGALIPGTMEATTRFTRGDGAADRRGLERTLMLLDQLTLLPDALLTKVDRAAMGVSLETRVPFLDHRVVEFAHRLPLPMLFDGRQGKVVLRDLLARHVPTRLFERPKQGFGVPLGTWLRGPLRDWAEDLLAPERVREQGLLDARVLGRRWHEFVALGASWEYQIWDVLMFQAWYRAASPDGAHG